MTGLVQILRESFEMLFNRPQLFVPRLFSASISSLAFIGFLSGFLGIFEMSLSLIFIALLGAFTPIMVSSMVKNEDGEYLREGFKDAIMLWKPILLFSGLALVIAVISIFPMLIGAFATYFTGNVIYLGFGALVSLILVLGTGLISGFSFYFVPITMLETEEFLESVKKSFNTSNRNRREVLLLTGFSVTVLMLTFLTTNTMAPSATNERIETAGYMLFFLGRMISSVVGTYLIVVSPNYYLKRGRDGG